MTITHKTVTLAIAAMLVSIGMWAQANGGSPVLNVSKESVSVTVTAESPIASATFTYTGEYLTPGTYDLSFEGGTPGGAWWDCSPKSVTVGDDGKLDAEITVTFDGEGGNPNEIPISLSITFGLAISSQSVSTEVVCYFNMLDYIERSINIEQLILGHGTSYDIRKALMNAMIDFQKIEALDSLSNAVDRNEPFLGLILKKEAEAMIGGWVKKNDVLRVKFGNIPEAVLVTINDAAPVEFTEHVYEFTATEDSYIKFSPKGTGSNLVIKQIMLNEPIADVTLPDLPTAIDNAAFDGKIVKTFENGRLIILKNNTKYNAQGAIMQ